MKRRSIITWITGLVALAALAVWFFFFRGTAEAVVYRTEAIDRGTVETSISATGTLEAVTTVQVGSQVSGTIAKLYADFNDKVKEGQLIAQLDPTFLQASVGEQQANVDRARAQMNEAQRNFDRTTGLFARQMVSQADLDGVTTSLETAKASLRQAEAALQRAQVNLKYATITAPISGVVISRSVDVGQTVAASLSAPTLYTIANDLTKMRVEASVDEADIGTVKVGMPVTFRVDAYPDDVFSGVLSQVRLQPITSQNVVTYVVIIDVENPEQKLMPGMTATVTIETAKRENVLRAPVQAIRFTPEGFTAGQFAGGNGNGNGNRPGTTPNPSDSANRQFAQNRSPSDSAGGRRMESRPRRMQSGALAGVPDSNMPMRPQPFDSTIGAQDKKMRVTLWVLDSAGLPHSVTAFRGVQSARYVELITDELGEGDQVIVGASTSAATAAVQGTNPFMPRFGGGGQQRGGSSGQRPSGGGGH